MVLEFGEKVFLKTYTTIPETVGTVGFGIYVVLSVLFRLGLWRMWAEQMKAKSETLNFGSLILFLVLVAHIFAAPYLVWLDEVDAHKGTATALAEARTSIGELNGKLKRKQRREAVIAKLEGYLEEGYMLTGHGVKNDTDLKDFVTKLHLWRRDVHAYITQHFSAADAWTFSNTEGAPTIGFAGRINNDHLAYISEAAQLRKNLQRLLESERAKSD